MKIPIFVAVIILSTFMISCTQEINPEEVLKNENEFKLTIYSKPFNSFDTLKTEIFPNNSERINKLKEWLTRNSEGWNSSIASWATPSISLTGKEFRMLIYENVLVIGFTDNNGKARQYTKQIEKREFDFLTENK